MMDQMFSLTHFSVYTYQGRCATHGIITNAPGLWKICEENDDIKNIIFKSTAYKIKKHRTQISCSICKIYKVHYQPILKKYGYQKRSCAY